MTILSMKRCNNCGKRFEIELLTEDEVREAEDQCQPTSPARCPECGRTDLRDGWE